MTNPAIKLRGGSSGPTLGPSTPGYVLTVQSDGASVKPESVGARSSYGTNVVVPALSASFADVTISTPLFANPGDVFSVSLGTSGGTPRLANVSALALWSPAVGQITLRFFGTNAGGSQLVTITKVYSATP